MSNLSLVRLNLMSKNGKRTGYYIYSPVVSDGNTYFYCESIKSDRVLRVKDVNVYSLVLTREIPKDRLMANGINVGSATELQESKIDF